MDESWTADPGAEVQAKEERKLLRGALAHLPDDYREVLVLKHFEDWSYEQISAVTGDSIGTLKVRAYRARQLLRERLADLDWVPFTSSGKPPAASEVGPGAEQ